MRNFTSYIKGLVLINLLMVSALSASAQNVPAAIGTDITGMYVDTVLTQYGLFGQYRTYVANPLASGVSKVEFPISAGNYSTVWRAYSGGQVLSGFNQIIDTTQSASALYNSGFGGSGILLPAVAGNMFYTFNIQNHATAGTINDTMAILATSYNPVSVTNVSIPVDTNTIGPACSPMITATLSAPPAAGENVYIRYSLTGFLDSSIVIPMTVSGNTARASIPAYPAGTHIDYYVLTTSVVLVATGPGSAYYDCLTLSLKNGGPNSNFRYTVKTLPVPSVSIAASSNPICQGATDTFVAHAVNNGTVAANYQWYKNGAAVGIDDSIYVDAGLNSNDSVWVAMTANLGCPVTDTSSHIIITVLPKATFSQSPIVCQGIAFNAGTHSYTVAGTYMDTIVAGGINGCDSIVTTVLTVLPLDTFTQSFTICAGANYIENGHAYTFTGVYMDTFFNAGLNGCDSIVTTNLTVRPNDAVTQNPTVCYGGSVTVGSNTYTATGTYTDVLTDVNGCDSTVTTNLTVRPNDAVTQNPTVCYGGSVTVGSNTYTATGTYTDVLTDVNGCDSTITTNLTVRPNDGVTQNPTVCYGGSVTVGSNTYTDTGTYTDVLTDVNGCDSTVTTNLTVLSQDAVTQNPTVCYGGSVTVGSNTYTATGTYTDVLTDVNGCDSTVTTNLTVRPNDAVTQNPTVCYGGSVTVGSNTYTATGTYTDVLTDVNGCDSTVTTNLTVRPNDAVTQNPTVCYGGSVTVGSNTYTATGTYTDVLTDVNGCDSTVTTNLTVRPNDAVTQNPTVCYGGSVTVGSNTYTATGTYTDVLTDVNGCDSTVTTNLTVRPNDAVTQNPTVCYGGSVTVGSNTYTATGTYTDVLTDVNGCDSTVTTNLTVRPNDAVTQNPTVCYGGSVTVGSNTYTATGTYTDVLTDVNGCDSTITTNLTVRPNDAVTQNPTVCYGGSVTVGSNTYTATGTYTDVLTDVNGCDSTVTTNLTVRPSDAVTQNPTVCYGGSVTVGSNTYTATGTYTDVLTDVNGCDSTVTTNLTVRPSDAVTQNPTVCYGGSVTVGSNTYTATGTYTDVLTDVNGCDSTVTTNLTVLSQDAVTQNPTVCYGGSVTVGSNTYTATGTYTDVLTDVNGCDSTVTTNLTVLSQDAVTQNPTVCYGGSVTVGSNTYTATGTYTDVLTDVNGCDSTITTNLTVRPNDAVTQNPTVCYGGSVTVGSNTYTATGTYTDVLTDVNGCDSTVTTNLTVRPNDAVTQNPTVCYGGSVTVGSTTYTATGTYTDVLTDVNGCDSTVTTNLTVGPQDAMTQNPVVCYGGSVIVGSNTYSSTGTYIDTLIAAGMNGCDSVVTTNLTVRPQDSTGQSITVCYGQSVTVNSHTYTSTGIYTDTLAAGDMNGCDSILTTNLTVRPKDSVGQALVICYGQSVRVNGHAYSSTGIYMDTLFAGDVNGCDSLVTTNLTVRPLDSIGQTITLCYGQSMTVGVHTYSSTGVYMDTLSGSDMNGCDSVITTNLTIRPQDSIGQTLVLCYGHSLTVGIHTYNSTGIYMDTLTAGDVNGCDSLITTNLTIRPKDSVGQTVALCYGQMISVGAHTYDNTGIYTDTLTAADVNGCDSAITTHLTIWPLDTMTQTQSICFGQSYTINGHTYTTPGTYTDTLTGAGAHGCDSIVTTNLIVNPLPVIALGAPVSQCGGSVQINAGNPGSTFIWSDGTTTQIDTASASGVYYVTVTTSHGCIDSGQKTIYIKPIPIVNLGPDITVCADSARLDAGNPGDNFMWTGGSTGEFLTVYSSGTYSVTVTDTSSHCSASDSIQVNLGTVPYTSLGNDTALCADSFTIQAKTGYQSYLWSNGDTTSSITVTATGNYSVTITGAGGCTAVGSILVTLYPKPNLGADVTDSICPSSRANLYNYYVNSGLALTYNTPTPASVDTGIYRVIGTNSNGCMDTAYITISYRQKPNAGGNKTDSVCAGYTYNLTTLYPNTGYANYVWNVANPTAVDTGTYMLVVTNASGCTDTAFATITQRSKPNPGGNKVDSICAGYTYDLTGLYPNTGYTTYTWTGVANPFAVGVGVYQLIVTNGSGCGDTAYATIIQKVQPVVTIPAYPNLCSTNPAFPLTGGAPAGGTYYVDNSPDSMFRTPILGPGTYHVIYVYTNASGCTDSASHDVTVYPQPQIIDTIGFPISCTGSPLINLNNYFSPNGGIFSGAGVSGAYLYPSLAPVGSDSVTYIYTDQNGCIDTAGRRIEILPSVKVYLHTAQSGLTICQGQSVTFTATGATYYQFFVNDSAWTTADTTSTFTATGLANHDQISVVGSNGCSSDTSDYIIIDVVAPPTVTAGPDTTIALGQTVQLYSYATGASALIYLWTPDSSLNLTNIPNPVYSGPDSIVFQLKVTDTYGCSATTTVTINVYVPDNVQLPNVITPNGDGKNDLWILNPKIDLAGSHLVIFNRWGEVVYETDNYNNDWGGTYKSTGHKVPDGTYYYVLTVPAQDNHTYKGPINVIASETN